VLVRQVDWMSRKRVPRSAAALIVTLGWTAVVLTAVGLVAARVSGQIDQVGESLQGGLARLRDYLGDLGINREQLASLQQSATESLTDNREVLTSGVISGATLLAEFLVGVFLFVVVLFFFLRDGRAMWAWVVARQPEAHAAAIDASGRAALVTLAAYLRGTAVIALADATLIGLALLLLGVPLVLPLSVLVFLGAFIPVVGSVVAGSVAVLVALITEGPVTAGLALLAVVVVQQVEGDVLAPLVFGRALSLHPLVVVVALTGGAVLAGVLGAAVSVPLVAAAWAVIRVVRPSVSDAPAPAVPKAKRKAKAQSQ
jgi:predicted PurR-regulated permease PerM